MKNFGIGRGQAIVDLTNMIISLLSRLFFPFSSKVPSFLEDNHTRYILRRRVKEKEEKKYHHHHHYPHLLFSIPGSFIGNEIKKGEKGREWWEDNECLSLSSPILFSFFSSFFFFFRCHNLLFSFWYLVWREGEIKERRERMREKRKGRKRGENKKSWINYLFGPLIISSEVMQ